MFRSHILSISLAVVFLMALACGGKKSHTPPPPAVGEIQFAFTNAAQTIRVPDRYLKAIGYLESRLTTTPASAKYPKRSVSDKSLSSAFGVELSQLSFTNEEDKLKLNAQISAYALWVAKKLEDAGVLANLPASPVTPDEKYLWLWELSNIQRNSDKTNQRNLAAIYYRELIEILNAGFVWQSPENGETLILDPERPPLKIEDLEEQNAKTLRLIKTNVEDIRGIAEYYTLPSSNRFKVGNNPTHIKVIHCPLSLSACLALQANSPEGDSLNLGAHYVIPAQFFDDDTGVRSAMQIAKHDEIVYLTDEAGIARPVRDAVVIMLSGFSGRMVDSVYSSINPKWYSDDQLNNLGLVVNGICEWMQFSKKIQTEECIDINNEKHGIRFQFQQSGKALRWGDIADFGYSPSDHKIFYAYLENYNGLLGEAVINLPPNRKIYNAGEAISLTVQFQNRVREMHLEQLKRCRDGRLIWVPIRIEPVRDATKHIVTLNLFSSGPDANGAHYFRTKVFSSSDNEDLLGWDIAEIYLKNYETEIQYATASQCF